MEIRNILRVINEPEDVYVLGAWRDITFNNSHGFVITDDYCGCQIVGNGPYYIESEGSILVVTKSELKVSLQEMKEYTEDMDSEDYYALKVPNYKGIVHLKVHDDKCPSVDLLKPMVIAGYDKDDVHLYNRWITMAENLEKEKDSWLDVTVYFDGNPAAEYMTMNDLVADLEK